MHSLMTDTEYFALHMTVAEEVEAAFTLYHGLEEFERLTREDKTILRHVAADA